MAPYEDFLLYVENIAAYNNVKGEIMQVAIRLVSLACSRSVPKGRR